MTLNDIKKHLSEEDAYKSDLRNPKVPECLYWTVDNVVDFMEALNFPQYKDCMVSNKIDGRKLIHLDASHLPSIGIKDYHHIIKITQRVRELLHIESPDWNRSICLPPRENLTLYLERKSFFGDNSKKISYERFEEGTKSSIWQPPLTNQGFILPNK